MELLSLAELVYKLLSKNGVRKVIPTSRRVRIIHNQTIIVDTTRAVHVWEHDFYPYFYFPIDELQNCTLVDKQLVRNSHEKVLAAIVELAIPAKSGRDAATNDRVIHFRNVLFTDDKDMTNMVRIEFGSVGKLCRCHIRVNDPFVLSPVS